MTNSFFKLSISVVLLTLVGYLFYDKFYIQKENVANQVEELLSQHLIDIHNEIAAVNTNISQVHHDYLRVGHYISGHEIKNGHATNFCVECGLLQQLSFRKNELEQELITLSDNKSPEAIKRCNDITMEINLLQSHLYNADKMSEAVNKAVRKIRIINNKAEPNGN